MWTLESYRIINSVAGWLNLGEFFTLRDVLNCVLENGESLDFRVTKPTGTQYTIAWESDSLDPDYVIPTLGEVCNFWPHFVGNVK